MNNFQLSFFTYPLIKENIIIPHLDMFVNIRNATIKEDTTRATDLVVELNGSSIAVRIRKPDCKKRDFTIRCTTMNNNQVAHKNSEISKVRNGFGDWYIYAWLSKLDFGDIASTALGDYIIVNLNDFRDSPLCNYNKWAIPNKDPDDTSFYAYTLKELHKYKILHYSTIDVIGKQDSIIDGQKVSQVSF